ncbi:DUF1727 domain-containing protein, partial [Candidatus Microgenomates bacterium]|nr:DUF1727 domain-containing protein [Candidatus Microgenomates bacterium]
GSTWPGHLGLFLDRNLFSFFAGKIKKRIIIVAGTNGKTTTSKMIRDVLEKKGNLVLHNESGANLLNGIASVFLTNYSFKTKYIADYAIFEIDEATLSSFLAAFNHHELTVVLLNLFRDQLDRYGEVDNIARRWQETAKKLDRSCILILNADDPQIASIGDKVFCPLLFFGMENEKLFLAEEEHATDSVYCLNCGSRLSYEGIYYSHVGIWSCPNCQAKRPKPTLSLISAVLPGLYNYYNTLATILTLDSLGISQLHAQNLLKEFKPAFGRQEEVTVQNKKIKIFLAKNPVGMNESLKTILDLKKNLSGRNKLVVILALNDNIPDGRDVSWIWDVDLEKFVLSCQTIICSGIRAADMSVRVKYALLANNLKDWEKIIIVENNLGKAIEIGVSRLEKDETLVLLPTYSAMLEARKILGGKKIL